MCVYCYMGDHTFRYDPPWYPRNPIPHVPEPVIPRDQIKPWDIERLKEYLELLKQVRDLEKELEEIRGKPPCDHAKADYITLIKEKIKELQELSEHVEYKET